MNKAEFRRWLARHKLNQVEAARRIGVHRVTVARWLSGARPLPHWLEAVLERIDASERGA